ncbi:MAG: DUF4178 domain-containing protein [Deltaproteobacteria bacterium]|nr:DUF4178 domain-containing protein [Deltaproteobacteria bacterium]
MENQILCPSCNAPIEIKDRFQEQLDCPYCGNQAYIGDRQNQAASKESGPAQRSPLTDVYSRFIVGQTGRINILGNTKNYQVTGRIQYEYEQGFWSEWYLNVDGAGYWLQEDEGIYTLFVPMALDNQAMIAEIYEMYRQSEESLKPGKIFKPLNSKMGDWTLLEYGYAKMSGYEGNLPFPPSEGKEIVYFDGLGPNKKYSLEIEDNGKDASLFQGWPLKYDDIEVESGGDYNY